MLTDLIRDVYVLSLSDDFIRREHIKKHFLEIGIGKYTFFEATHHCSEKVKKYYREDLVQAYPPCFRCNKIECMCENNIIIPQQVANWISFLELWELISTREDGLYLICEDDVCFFKNSIYLLNEFLVGLDIDGRPTLIRMSQSGLNYNVDLTSLSELCVGSATVMSNPAYIINREMARFLVDSFCKISTTSDIWIHSIVGCLDNVRDITLDPLIATELSYNSKYAKFVSRIHPKGIDDQDVLRAKFHKKRARNVAEYVEIKQGWKL